MPFFDSDAEARAEALWGQGIFEDWTLAGTLFVDGPTGVEVRNTDDDPIRRVRVALAWDGATLHEAGPTPLGRDDVAAFEVLARRGGQLEVWVSAAAPLRVRRVPLADLRERDEARDEADERDRRDRPAVIPGWAGWAIAAALIGGIVLSRR